MKRLTVLSVLLASIFFIVSCSNINTDSSIDTVDLGNRDRHSTVTALLDKSLEEEYNRIAEKPIIFCDESEYRTFSEKY